MRPIPPLSLPPSIRQPLSTIYRVGRSFIETHFARIFGMIIFVIVAAVTISQQNTVVGFERGYDALAPKHHGSISSRGLAIISQATLQNDFVGFAVRYKDDQGQFQYDYFDRYPVFFSALFNRLLELRPKLSSKIYLAKQAMNVIYLATLLVAYLLGSRLIRNRPLALCAVLITFSNPYLLFYKDMVHFDQPALLGFLLLTYAISLYKLDGLKWPVYLATFVAVAMGRGYASYAVLGLWLLIEAILILRKTGQAFGQKVRELLRHPALILTVLGILWGGSLLSYNIIIEARTRNIPILQTSIIDSASRRLAFNATFNETNADIIDWPGYIRTEVSRIIQWSSPVKWPYPNAAISAILLLGMLGVIGYAMRKQGRETRVLFLILTLAGFIWMTLMRNLAAFHDYTTMYFIGVPLAFLLAVLLLLKPSRDAAYYLALIGMVLYIGAVQEVRHLHEANQETASEFTYDFMRIEEKIAGTGNNIYFSGQIPNATNAEEFYLQDQYLSPLSLADYVISWDSGYSSANLTPDNTFLFLFKKK